MKQFRIYDIWNKLRLAAAALCVWAGRLIGGMDALMTALLCFMALDYVSGVLCAFESRRLSSAAGFKGICRKALIIAVVGAAHMADSFVTGTGGALRSMVIGFYISNEALSLFENAARLGLPVPEKLKSALSALHGKEDETR